MTEYDWTHNAEYLERNFAEKYGGQGMNQLQAPGSHQQITKKYKELTMNIVDWFDIHDQDHLQAWSHLSIKGTWPVDFIPDKMRFQHNWNLIISMKMADAWVSYATQCHQS